MRWLATLLVLPLLTPTAAGHGCGGHGPNGGVPPGLREPSDPEPPPPPSGEPVLERGIPCDCGLIECEACSDVLRHGADAQVSLPAVTVTKCWGDVARCRVEVTFETSRDPGMVEGYARIEPAPLFAAVAGSVRNREGFLSAKLKPSEEARGKYLYARRLFNFDPLLALRRGPGRIDVRVYPLSKGKKAVVVLKGYVLMDGCAPDRARLYRTGDRYLAVAALATDAHRDTAAFRDEANGRSLHFLSQAECRERFGTDAAEEVPFVPALESAATGCGSRAASDDTALLAIAAGSLSPPFVGPDRFGGPLPEFIEPPPPPGHPTLVPVARFERDLCGRRHWVPLLPRREPSDPEPPPPDPAVRDAADR